MRLPTRAHARAIRPDPGATPRNTPHTTTERSDTMQQHDPKTCPGCGADDRLQKMLATELPDNSTPPKGIDDVLNRGVATVRAVTGELLRAHKAAQRGEHYTPRVAVGAGDIATLFTFAETIQDFQTFSARMDAAQGKTTTPDSEQVPPAPEAKADSNPLAELLPMILAAVLSGQAKVEVIDLTGRLDPEATKH